MTRRLFAATLNGLKRKDRNRQLLFRELVKTYAVTALVTSVWMVAYYISLSQVDRGDTYWAPLYGVTIAAIVLWCGSLAGLGMLWLYHVACKLDPDMKNKAPPDLIRLGYLRKTFFP